jgi:hypothetical protein
MSLDIASGLYQRKRDLTDVLNPIVGMVLDLEPLALLHIAALDALGAKRRHVVGAFLSDLCGDAGLDGCVNRCQPVLHLVLMMNQERCAEFHHGSQLVHRVQRYSRPWDLTSVFLER